MSFIQPSRRPDTWGREPEPHEFRVIYEAHLRLVCHALRRFSVAEKDVLDAAQNVFLVVHRKLPEFEGRSQLKTWILQITRRVASDYRRSASVRREVSTESSDLDEGVGGERSAEELAVQKQRVEVARGILDRLPDTQREVFIMFELEQLSGAEIAEELSLPVGTVRSRLRLARATFQAEVARMVTPESRKEVG